MSDKTYEERLDALMDAYTAKVGALTAEVRRDLVLPACVRHGYRFVSANGRYFFHGALPAPHGLHVSTIDEADAASFGIADLLSVFAVLNLEVRGNQRLGYYVEGVTEADVEAERAKVACLGCGGVPVPAAGRLCDACREAVARAKGHGAGHDCADCAVVDRVRFGALRAEWRREGVTADSAIDYGLTLSVRARNAVQNLSGAYLTVRELAALPRSTVALTKNCGATSLEELDALLAFCGLSWAPEPTLVPRGKASRDNIERLAAVSRHTLATARRFLRGEPLHAHWVNALTRHAKELGILAAPSPEQPETARPS